MNINEYFDLIFKDIIYEVNNISITCTPTFKEPSEGEHLLEHDVTSMNNCESSNQLNRKLEILNEKTVEKLKRIVRENKSIVSNQTLDKFIKNIDELYLNIVDDGNIDSSVIYFKNSKMIYIPIRYEDYRLNNVNIIPQNEELKKKNLIEAKDQYLIIWKLNFGDLKLHIKHIFHSLISNKSVKEDQINLQPEKKEKLIEKIKDSISKNNIREAISQLLIFSENYSNKKTDEILNISGKYELINSEHNMGKINFEEYNQNLYKIRNQLLNILKK